MLLLHSCDSWSLGSCCCESCVQGPRSHNAATLFAQPHGTLSRPTRPHLARRVPLSGGELLATRACNWNDCCLLQTAACYTRLQFMELLLLGGWPLVTRLGGSTRTLARQLTLFASYSFRSPLGLPYVRLAYLSAWLKLQACAAPHVAMPH